MDPCANRRELAGRNAIPEQISCRTTLWRWTGAENGSWHFVTIAGEAGEVLSGTALMRKLEGTARGFGSLRVTAAIGETRWQTSVFPSRDNGWMLPVKAAVRKAEGIEEGDAVDLRLEF